MRKLCAYGFTSIITKTHNELDLTDQYAVYDFFSNEKPEYVFLAAAKVGGIYANATYPADFIRENIQIQTNIIEASRLYGVKKLLFLGSSCIYPKLCPQPIKEEYLLTGELEPTNEAYAVVKIAGVMMCKSYAKQYGTSFMSVMPTNIYMVQVITITRRMLMFFLYCCVVFMKQKNVATMLWLCGGRDRHFENFFLWMI